MEMYYLGMQILALATEADMKTNSRKCQSTDETNPYTLCAHLHGEGANQTYR
jgi:hypothetical protein